MSHVVIEEFPHADEIGAHCTACQQVERRIGDNRDHWRDLALWTAKHECAATTIELEKWKAFAAQLEAQNEVAYGVHAAHMRRFHPSEPSA